MWTNFDRAIRHLRRDRGWTQQQLADRAGVSRAAISRAERGLLSAMTVHAIEAVARALGASLSLQVRWRGAELDRLIDAAHATLQNAVAAMLAATGWTVHVEVSFNRYGDRGRIDVFALHPALRIGLVIEVKSGIGDIQETLGRLDVKVRVARAVAREMGWGEISAVVPVLVVGDSRAARTVIATHASLFARFRVRGRAALAWIRHPDPSAPSGLLWFGSVRGD